MLPKTLKYGSKVSSAQAQSFRTSIAPQNGVGPYSLGNTIIINIPTSNNTVLVPNESYLKFGLGFGASAVADCFRLDSCGAHGLIQRIRIFHSSNLIQDIDNYGLLAKMLFDLQVPTDSCYGRFSELAGTRSDLMVTTPDAIGAINYLPAQQINSGEGFNFALNGTNSNGLNNCIPALTASVNAVPVRYYCLNLISLLGTLCTTNYFPLFACSGSPLRIEIQLASSAINAGMNFTGNTVPSLYNVEYVGNFIKLSDNAMSMIYSSLDGEPLQFVVPDYANYQFTTTLTQNVTTQVNFAIPAKYSSLKSIFLTVRDKGTGASTFFPFSSVAMGILSYYFRVGSQIMPTKSPDNLPEMFSECLKAIGSMSDINYQSSIDRTSYEQQVSVASTIANNGSIGSGSFYIGLDLENYINAPKDNIFCGMNTNTDDIFAVLNFYAPATVVTRFDAFALFDSVIEFQNGVCFRKF